MAENDPQQQSQPTETPPAPAPAPAAVQPAPAPAAQDGMPPWATDLQKQLNDLAGTVAKLPETTVNAVREATQPAKQPRQRTTTKTTATKTETASEPAPADEQEPGKSRTFRDWWFN